MTNVASLVDQDPIERPAAAIRWLARVLCWLCWIGIAFCVGGIVAAAFNLDASGADFADEAQTGVRTLIDFDARLEDEAANAQAMAGLQRDVFYRIGGLIPEALYIWALLSARRSFIGVGRGEYFARPTALSLRNLALAVLLYHTLAPLLEAIPRVLYLMRTKGERTAELSFGMGISEPVMLMLVFAGAVALVSTVMARAAKIAEENRQFV